MSETQQNPAEQRRLREEARAWHVRLYADEATGEDWLAFEHWLAADPSHLSAYEAVEAVLADVEALAPAQQAKVVAFKPRARRGLALMTGAAAAAGLAAAVMIGVVAKPPEPPEIPYAANAGASRVVTLADGSRVTLSGGSSIAVRLGKRERHVRMGEAEAVFDVAKDASRPFIIEAGDRQVRVVGTEFDVLRDKGLLRVTVRRGVVEVRPSQRPDAAPIARLTRGQSLTHTQGQSVDSVAAADPDTVMAWTEGRLVFRGETLAEALKTVNRHVSRPITASPDAAALPVTAVIQLGPEDAMLKSLEAFLPIRAEPTPDANGVRLSLRR